MKFDILTSGSQGNAILFDDGILLDTGISFKKLPKIKMVLLTHIHGDHFNSSTIRNIHVNDESIKFCCGNFLVDDLLKIGLPKENIKIIEAGKLYKFEGVTFSPFNLYHDVPNFGYRLMKDGYKHIHATDTFSIDGITAKDYDSATLEANHCIDAARKIIDDRKKDREFCHLERAVRTHLSVQKSVEFIKKNNIKKHIPVHIGSATLGEVKKYIKSNY